MSARRFALALVAATLTVPLLATPAAAADDFTLPFYDPAMVGRPLAARHLIEEVRHADGVVLVSPGYHGTVSGLVKNALDYLEDLLVHLPARYEDRSRSAPLGEATEGTRISFLATVRAPRVRRGGGFSAFEARLEDASGSRPAVWYHQPYLARTLSLRRSASTVRLKRRGMPSPEVTITRTRL